jgi:hypothetical protein
MARWIGHGKARCPYYGASVCNDGKTAEATACRGDRWQCEHRDRLRREEEQT